MKKRIIAFEIIIILFILALLAGALFFVNFNFFFYLKESKEKVISEVERFIGYKIKYERFSPDIIGSLKIHEVELYDDEGFRFELGNVKVSYSLWAYLKDRDNSLALIRKIYIKKIELAFNKEETLDKLEQLKSRFQGNRGDFDREMLEKIENLTIEVPEIEVTVADNGNSYNLKATGLKVIFKEDRIHLSLVSDLRATLEKPELDAYLAFKINGFLHLKDNDFLSDLNLDFFTININDNILREQKFAFESKNSDFTFYRLKDRHPLSLEVIKKGPRLSTLIKIEKLSPITLFLSKDDLLLLPDSITLNSAIDFDIKSRLLEGDLGFYVYYQKLFMFNNLELLSNLSIEENRVDINRFSLYNGNRDGYLNVGGYIPLDGSRFKVDFDFFDFSLLNFKINSGINLEKRGKRVELKADYLLVNGIDFGNFLYRLTLWEKGALISTVKSFNGYNVEGRLDFKEEDKSLYLKHSFKEFALHPFVRVVNPGFKKSIYFNSELEQYRYKGRFYIKEAPLTIKQDGKTLVNFSLKQQANNFYLNNFLLAGKEFNAGMRIRLQSQRKSLSEPIVVISSFAENEELAMKVYSAVYNDKVTLSVNDSLRMFYNMNNSILAVRAVEFALPIPKQNIVLNTAFNLNINRMTINPAQLRLDNVKLFRSKPGTITAGIELKDNRLLLKDFNYSDNKNEISGDIVNSFDLREGPALEGNFFLKDDAKGESYSGNYKIKDNRIDSRVYLTHFDLNKVLPTNIQGHLNLRLGINGELSNPSIAFEGDLSKGTISGNSFDFLFIAQKNDEKLSIDRVFLQFNKSKLYINDSIVLLGKDRKNINLKSSLYLDDLNKKFKSNLSLKGDFVSGKEFAFDLLLDEISVGYYDLQKKLTNVEKFKPLKFNLTAKDELVVFKNYGRKFVYAAKENKDVYIKLYNKEKTIFDVEANYDNDRLSGRADFNEFPINILERLLTPFVGLQEGLISGSIELKGKPNYPEYYGKLKVYHAKVALDAYLPKPIVNVSGIVVADGNQLIVNSVNGMVDSEGLVHGNGKVVFNGWKFENYYFDVNSNMVPAHFKQGPLEAEGNGYVKSFIFEGKPGNFNFIADLYVENGVVDLKMFQPENGFVPDKIPVNVMLNFTAGKRVVVNYPLINGTVKSGEKMTLKYFGEDNSLYLGGEVSLRKGEINYMNKTFKIEQANVQFFEDESEINPVLNIKSFYRTKDDGEKIKLYLDVYDRLLSFKTNFYSVPYRSSERVNAILGLATVNNSSENNNGQFETSPSFETISNTTNYLGNTVLVSPLENSIRSSTGLDTFALNTSLFGNIFTNQGNILDLLDESSITIGKYVFDGIYLQSLMTFNKKNDINDTLFIPMPNQDFGLNLEMMIQLDLPFISLGYTFAPKDLYNFSNAEHIISLETSFKF